MKYLLLIILAFTATSYVDALKFQEGRPQGYGDEKEDSIATFGRLFKTGKLTLKESQNIYGTHLTININWEAERFCDAYTQSIMAFGNKILSEGTHNFDALETSLAALWLLIKCQWPHSKGKEASLKLAAAIIDEPQNKDLFISHLVHDATRNLADMALRDGGIRAARLAALFSADRNTRTIYGGKYNTLIEGTKELDLEGYSLAKDTTGSSWDDINLGSSSDDEEQANQEMFLNPTRTSKRSQTRLGRFIKIGATLLCFAALMISSYFVYQKYGRKSNAGTKPQKV